jgi:hypothetical protein
MDMKKRTGKECKKINCKNYKYYSNWGNSMGCSSLRECMECKHAHVSQYKPQNVDNDRRNIVYH